MYKGCILPVFLGTTLNHLSIHAAEMEHVLVTTPIHKSEAQTALPITVLTGDELRSKMASSLGETLGSMPGLANASFGPAVGQPVIRGQQGARVTVLQNGTGSGDASNASADHAVSVEPILAESIEVLRGPSTLLFGGGAVGGVVNVIDRRVPETVPDKLSGALELRHGSVNDETTAVFKLEGGSEQFGFYLSGVSRDTNNIDIPGHAAVEPDEHERENKGFIANSDSEMETLTVGGSYIFEEGFIGLAVSHLENEYGLPPGAHGHHEEGGAHDEDHEDGEEGHHDEYEEEHEEEEGDIRLDIKQIRYDLRGAIIPHNLSDDHVIESLRWALSYTDYEHDEIHVEPPGEEDHEHEEEQPTHFSNESWEGRFELVHREWLGMHGAVGFQFLESEFATSGEEGFIPKTDISRYGLFVVEDFHHGDVMYELGARIDRDTFNPDVTSEESYTSVSLSGSALWNLNDQWQLGLALSSSERAPVTEELFSNQGLDFGEYITHAASGVIEVGNTALESEQAINVDLSVSYSSESLEGFVTLYYNDFSDYIYLANSGAEQGETAVFEYQQQDARFSGLEFELALLLAEAYGGDFTLTLQGDAIKGELSGAGDIPRMPPLRAAARLEFASEQFNSYIALSRSAKQDKPGDFEEQTDAYSRWDAGMSYRFGDTAREYRLFVKLKNLSDEDIRSSVSFLRDSAPEAGRSVEVGVRLTF